jgi:hypothetical protein
MRFSRDDRSPGGAKRNKGIPPTTPDCAVLHPGYELKICPLYAGMSAHDFHPNKKTWEEIMTSLLNSPNHQTAGSSGIDRRKLLRNATALAATALAAPQALARNFNFGAEPQRYPDPDIVVIDDKRFKAKVGNTSIKRLYTGCLWAEGPAWNAHGRYLVWSDIPNNRQLRYLDENGSISAIPPMRPTATLLISKAARSPPSAPGWCATSTMAA